MIGKTISHYRIIEKLGEGGMGEVYLAEDKTLKRHVAIKFLPSKISVEDSDKKRFLQEARAAAAINHPNVCVIHEIKFHEESPYIVMEYIKGVTLREFIRMSEIGSHLSDEKINYAIQIADALHAAHEKDIIHRDIKSDNIMVTDTGQIKVMDFGLAKLTGSVKLTKSTSTVGTLAYMAPEQIEGRNVDARSDIFSFGVLLYELLAGHLPFKGEYESSLMYSIINEDPEPIRQYIPEISSEWLHILDRALEKDPESRYQSIKEALIDLRRLKRDSDRISRQNIPPVKDPVGDRASKIEIPSVKPKHKLNIKIFIGIFTVLMLSVLMIIYFPKGEEKLISQPATHTQITFTGKAHLPEISPDGSFLAYISTENSDQDNLFVQDLSGGKALSVFSAKEIFDLRWAPDGAHLSVMAVLDTNTSGSMFFMPRLGGESEKYTYFPFHAWSPDGSMYAGAWLPDKQISLINKGSVKADNSIELSGDFNWIYEIDWSPSNDNLLFLTLKQEENMIWTVKTDGLHQQKVLIDSADIRSPRWSADGSAIYYLRSDSRSWDLMKIPVDPVSGNAVGAALKLQSGFQSGEQISLSKYSQKLIYTREATFSNLRLLQKNGEEYQIKSLTSGTAEVSGPSLSPDGKKIAFSLSRGNNANIHVIPVEGGPAKQLTFFESSNYSPVWSADGKEIAFLSNEGGQYCVWKVSGEGGQLKQFKKSSSSSEIKWAPYDNILYQYNGNRNFHFLDPETGIETELVPNDSVGWMFKPCYSPDKQKLAVYWNRPGNGGAGIYLISLIDSSQILLKSGYCFPNNWSSDGEWIYAVYNDKPTEIVKINVTNGREKPFYRLPYRDATIRTVYSTFVSPDEKMIITLDENRQEDVWVMENFDPTFP